MEITPKASRLHITILGRRNVGKSSFMNAFLNQLQSIVSDVAGTTTDPVEKAYELQPFGPIVITDTAGIDDSGHLGLERIKRTKKKLLETDFALLLIDEFGLTDFELNLITDLKEKKIPFLPVINKIDIINEKKRKEIISQLEHQNLPHTICSAITTEGIDEIKSKVVEILENLEKAPPIIKDLVKPLDTVILVIPIDKEAPVGRIILPQVQTLREILDIGGIAISVTDNELDAAIKNCKEKPALVVTDSQAFHKVKEIIPDNITLTSFSILYARHRGDLPAYIKALDVISKLQDGDKILIAESCSHRPIAEDIGRIKIPNWLKTFTGKKLDFAISAGKDFPEDLSKYKLIVQCGGCMANRKLIISRINLAKKQNVAITNYGVLIAYLNGILERSLTVFN